MNEKFNSQICTTKEQSQHLLDLGLKPETSDMVLFKSYDLPQYPVDYTFNQDPNALVNCIYVPMIKGNQPFIQEGNIPAWSLHRLIELYKDVDYISLWGLEHVNYDHLIQCISFAIKHGIFNKEYLKQ